MNGIPISLSLNHQASRWYILLSHEVLRGCSHLAVFFSGSPWDGNSFISNCPALFQQLTGTRPLSSLPLESRPVPLLMLEDKGRICPFEWVLWATLSSSPLFNSNKLSRQEAWGWDSCISLMMLDLREVWGWEPVKPFEGRGQNFLCIRPTETSVSH